MSTGNTKCGAPTSKQSVSYQTQTQTCSSASGRQDHVILTDARAPIVRQHEELFARAVVRTLLVHAALRAAPIIVQALVLVCREVGQEVEQAPGSKGQRNPGRQMAFPSSENGFVCLFFSCSCDTPGTNTPDTNVHTTHALRPATPHAHAHTPQTRTHASLTHTRRPVRVHDVSARAATCVAAVRVDARLVARVRPRRALVHVCARNGES